MRPTRHAHPDDPFENLRRSFREETEERLGLMDKLVEEALKGAIAFAAALAQLRRDAHTIKGMGDASGFPLVSTVAHRLENYLDDIDGQPYERSLKDIRAYIDAMTSAMAGAASDDSAIAAVLRSLPVPTAFNPDDVVMHRVEALLVTASRVVGRLVGRELGACGIRAVLTQSPSEAFTLAIRMRPDLIIASATLAEVSGMELAGALAAMATTSKIPIAILTSLSKDDLARQGLPAGIPTIHTGERLSGDLAAVITGYGIG